MIDCDEFSFCIAFLIFITRYDIAGLNGKEILVQL